MWHVKAYVFSKVIIICDRKEYKELVSRNKVFMQICQKVYEPDFKLLQMDYRSPSSFLAWPYFLVFHIICSRLFIYKDLAYKLVLFNFLLRKNINVLFSAILENSYVFLPHYWTRFSKFLSSFCKVNIGLLKFSWKFKLF